ncbi:DUF4097 family beta strand repeat-containing protein [Luteimicrobium sp. NPDC057192]|uniref:DUF4097 family beta strand repeat-containing protein n=1 Tax=Luteimicrobium sp. NPDC057192 TaxID=3346042 RepID=UPI0036431F86
MQKFDTTAPVSAVLDIPAGALRLIAADRADTTVDVRPANPSKGRDVKAAERVIVSFEGGVLRVALPVEHELLGPSGAVEVTVQLPAGSSVEAKGAALDVRGVGRLGDVTVKAAQGPVKLDEAADARLAIQAGDVTVGRLTGSGELSTAKGDLRVDEATRGSLALTTQAGSITIGVATGVSASLDAGTALGRISNALRSTGEAELTIRATTALGDITASSL